MGAKLEWCPVCQHIGGEHIGDCVYERLAAAERREKALVDAIWEVQRGVYLDDDVINRFPFLNVSSEALKNLFRVRDATDPNESEAADES